MQQLGRLGRRRYLIYELANGSRMCRPTINLDVAVFDAAQNVVCNWTRTIAYVEQGGYDCVSGVSFLLGCYTGTNPGPPIQFHMGNKKTETYRNIPAGQA